MALNDPLSIHKIDTDVSEATPSSVEEALKDHYYRVDPAEYFERRLWGIIALADMRSDSESWNRTDESSLFGQFQSILKSKKFADVPPGDTLSSRTMASIESYTLMQHVIETALRLFVAGQERITGSSPLTTLLNIRQASDLRDPIKPLLGAAAKHAVIKVMFPPELRHEDTENSELEMRRHLEFLTAWLSFFARFYSQEHFNGAQGNNQLKHGATATPRGDVQIAHLAEVIQPLTSEQWDEGASIINAESITYVVRGKGGKNVVPELMLRTDNSDPATNLAISQVGISIVRSLWQMSQVVAYPAVVKNYEYDYSPLPDELFANTSRPPRSVTEILVRSGEKRFKSSAAQQGRKKR